MARASREETTELFEEYRRTGDRAVRNRIVEDHLGLADYFVRRYARRGASPEDLRQLALLAIVRASDRFDPDVGVAFSTFASRTIEGELKRHLRDKTWSVRPPRRAQELHLEVRRAEEDLTHELGRSPTVREVAARVDADEDHVLEAMEAGTARTAASLDQPTGDDPDARSRGDRVLVSGEPGYGHVADRMLVDELLDELPERERSIVIMRFYDNMSQPDIAEAVGVSQSYLSRILRRVLAELRERAEAGPPPQP